MHKKTNYNRRKQTVSQKTNVPSKITFTMPIVKILKDSLATFEILLLAHDNTTIPNLELAHLTFGELKQKLIDMLEREEWEKITSFDYNELWILYTSLAMYITELQLRNEGDTTKLPVCIALRNQLNALIEIHR